MRIALVGLLLLTPALFAQDEAPSGPNLDVVVLRCLLMRRGEASDDPEELAGLQIVPQSTRLAPGEDLKFPLGRLQYSLSNKSKGDRLRAAFGQYFEGFGHSMRRSMPVLADAVETASFARSGVVRARAQRGGQDRNVACYLVYAMGSPDDETWGEAPHEATPGAMMSYFRQRFRDAPGLMTALGLLDLAALFRAPDEAIEELESAAALLQTLVDDPENPLGMAASLPGIRYFTPEHRLERALIRAGAIEGMPDWRAMSGDRKNRVPGASMALYRAYVMTPLPPSARLTALGRFLSREDDVDDLESIAQGLTAQGDSALADTIQMEIVEEIENRIAGRRLAELIPLAFAGFIAFVIGALALRFLARWRLQG